MSLQGLFDIKKIKNPNPGRWKANNLVDPVLFSLVYQLSGGHTFGVRSLFATHDTYLKDFQWLRMHMTCLNKLINQTNVHGLGHFLDFVT